MQIVPGVGLEFQKAGKWLVIPGCTGVSLFEFQARLLEIQQILLSSGASSPVALYSKNDRFRYCLHRAIAANQVDPDSLTIEERLVLILPTQDHPTPPLVQLNEFPPEIDERTPDPYALPEDGLDSVGKFVAMLATAHGESMDLSGAWALAARTRAVDLIVMVRAIGRSRMLPEDREKAYLRRKSNEFREQQRKQFEAFAGNQK